LIDFQNMPLDYGAIVSALNKIVQSITGLSFLRSTAFDVVNVAVPNSNTDVEYAIPNDTKQIFIKLRSQYRLLRVYKASAGDFFTIPQNGWLSPKNLKTKDQTLIFQVTFTGAADVIEILLFN